MNRSIFYFKDNSVVLIGWLHPPKVRVLVSPKCEQAAVFHVLTLMNVLCVCAQYWGAPWAWPCALQLPRSTMWTKGPCRCACSEAAYLFDA